MVGTSGFIRLFLVSYAISTLPVPLVLKLSLLQPLKDSKVGSQRVKESQMRMHVQSQDAHTRCMYTHTHTCVGVCMAELY